jgi:MOSC domain-containing protein YiiM
MIHIRHLFVSPGHNFFGHHGRPPGDAPTLEVDAIECVAGRGIRGDRFFDFKADYRGQITFFAWEDFEQLVRALGATHAQPSAMRRNVITEHADLRALIGQSFEIQGVQFRGMEECKPCHWMDHALLPGAEAWLRGRGGLRAQILTSGWLRRRPLAPA